MTTPKKQYFNPSVTVDVVLFTIEDKKLKVLLINRDNEPFKGTAALPGGFIREGEVTKDAALRVLREKAGVKNIYLEQLYTFDSPNRDPRGAVFSVTYMALVPSPFTIEEQKGRTQHPELFDIKKLPKLAFDHKNIISYAIERIRGKLEYTTIGFTILPKLFTLSQVQDVYETILDKELDKRNFRKKLEQWDIIKETKEKLTGMPQRPAKLYTVNQKLPGIHTL